MGEGGGDKLLAREDKMNNDAVLIPIFNPARGFLIPDKGGVLNERYDSYGTM